MPITETELRTMFIQWCDLNGFKKSNGQALNAFCRFAKNYFEIRG